VDLESKMLAQDKHFVFRSALYIFNQLTEFRAKLLEIGKKRTH